MLDYVVYFGFCDGSTKRFEVQAEPEKFAFITANKIAFAKLDNPQQPQVTFITTLAADEGEMPSRSTW